MPFSALPRYRTTCRRQEDGTSGGRCASSRTALSASERRPEPRISSSRTARPTPSMTSAACRFTAAAACVTGGIGQCRCRVDDSMISTQGPRACFGRGSAHTVGIFHSLRSHECCTWQPCGSGLGSVTTSTSEGSVIAPFQLQPQWLTWGVGQIPAGASRGLCRPTAPAAARVPACETLARGLSAREEHRTHHDMSLQNQHSRQVVNVERIWDAQGRLGGRSQALGKPTWMTAASAGFSCTMRKPSVLRRRAAAAVAELCQSSPF